MKKIKVATVNNFEFANDENKIVAKWLIKTVDGNKVLAKVKDAKDLEKEVREVATRRGIRDLEIDNEDEGLEWVAFGDLFNELKDIGVLFSESKIYYITKTQKIEVKPIGYVNNDVTCEIPDTTILFSVHINKLKTEKHTPVTRKMLAELWEKS